MKKRILLITFLFLAFQGFAQTMYVKLKESIEKSQSLVDKVNQEFTVQFSKSKLTSKVLNGNIYKIEHSLNISDAKKLHRLLKEDTAVMYASLMYEPVVPPNDIPPATTDFILSQSYLDSDPGVDAKYAWANGSDGSNVTVRAVEYGVNVNHEEFAGRSLKIADGMSISSSATFAFTTHGTATAGVVYSDDGAYGTKGIAYNADEYILYPEWQEGQSWNRIEAVTNAVNAANVGDIIIYEMQISGANGDNFVMAEFDPLVWDLTLTATNKGAIVVAAAGNGGVNIDGANYDDYHARGDSGAIIIGASIPGTNHISEGFSTYGERVNMNAWGRNVFTTGYGDISFGNDLNQYYTDGFGGTSSATAISGGCIANLQSFYYNLSGGSYLTPIEMRDLLEETGIEQASDTRPIGVFINMKAAIDRLIVLGTSNENFSNNFVVFPNPSNDFIKVKLFSVETKISLDLYNSLGKLMLSKQTTEQDSELDISRLSQGVYYLRVTSGSKSGFKRIVKN